MSDLASGEHSAAQLQAHNPELCVAGRKTAVVKSAILFWREQIAMPQPPVLAIYSSPQQPTV
jgi:hypothetical protein